jgi:hypothetical protein
MLQPEETSGSCSCLILHPSCTGQTSRTCTGCPVHQRLRAAIQHRGASGCCCCLRNAHIAAGVLLMDTFQKEESM